jgi:hypothetical protein
MKNLIFTLLLLATAYFAGAQANLEVPQTQKLLITKHTATWCPNCGLPESWNLQQFFADSLDGKGAVVLSAHRSTTSKLYSPAGKGLLDTVFSAIYQPEYFLNTTRLSGNESAVKAEVIAKVTQAATQAPVAQTGLKATYIISTDSLVIATKTKFFQSATGEYRLAILLVEKVVQETQASRTGVQPHKRILRRTLTPGIAGIGLFNGIISANGELNRNITIKWNNQYNLNNIEIVTIIWKRTDAGQLEFVNTNEVTQVQQSTTAAQEVDFLAGRFDVTPNPAQELTQIRLNLPKSYSTAEITLLDAKGRVVKTLYRGSLNSGQQTIDMNRDAVAGGVYVVRLRADGQIATRKVAFQ